MHGLTLEWGRGWFNCGGGGGLGGEGGGVVWRVPPTLCPAMCRDVRCRAALCTVHIAMQSDDGGREGMDAAARELELRLLLTFCKDAKHFAVQAVLGCGAYGVVFAVKCTHADFPFPDKVLLCRM